ncbi:MAG: glutamate ABC transporter substrate-binding protein [Gordonia sp.]|uniref:glutamate ABC transporter substrate-binding protein n=1 Tax=Gordonia sp. (in: high G+C Gram-positive bacteria) TaxID=84139 RepID=UPI001D839034|nr:glutamate ABC transporter substrate-binding protein [Gordonia sp. (in: high G+C Gram-positive bacteria)]MCB1294581.1 glutamate ABC transporter substrate-binding protein [Gordonia sp. (in: high G+C Gram-positive bacteria)]
MRRQTVTLTILIAVLGTVGALLAGCGSTEPRSLVDSIRKGSVVLGTKFDQPGLGIYNPDNGGVDGFDADVSRYVVNHIADKLGVKHPKVKWRETPSARREAMIENGEVDTIAATYSINAARSKKVSFAGPYLVTYQGLLVRRDDDSITQLTDLQKDKKLCSVTGSTSAQNVKAQLPSVQLQEFDSYSACVEGLRRGKVDALTTDESILAGYSNFWSGEFKLVEMTYPKDACVKEALKSAGAPFSTERYGIGVGKDDGEAVALLNEALTAMLKPGADGISEWMTAIRKNLGDEFVDQVAARAATPDSKYKFEPTVGDLSFLDSASTPCPPGLK